MGTPLARTSLITLTVTFKDFTQPVGVPTDVTNPRIRILHDKVTVSVNALGVTQNADGTYDMSALIPPQTGTYKFAFLPDRTPAGVYNLEFTGEFTDPSSSETKTLIVNGTIGIGEISRLEDWIVRIKRRLMDDFPEWYRLDEPIQQFQPDQLYSYIRDVIDRLNNIGPRITNYDIDGIPDSLSEFVVTGAMVFALYARARLEKANEMNYSDLHTLNIQRADFYKSLADSLWKDWEEAVLNFKKATPPTPIGLRAQRLPFRVFRVIGLLPNYQSFFSG